MLHFLFLPLPDSLSGYQSINYVLLHPHTRFYYMTRIYKYTQSETTEYIQCIQFRVEKGGVVSATPHLTLTRYRTYLGWDQARFVKLHGYLFDISIKRPARLTYLSNRNSEE